MPVSLSLSRGSSTGTKLYTDRSSILVACSMSRQSEAHLLGKLQAAKMQVVVALSNLEDAEERCCSMMGKYDHAFWNLKEVRGKVDRAEGSISWWKLSTDSLKKASTRTNNAKSAYDAANRHRKQCEQAVTDAIAAKKQAEQEYYSFCDQAEDAYGSSEGPRSWSDKERSKFERSYYGNFSRDGPKRRRPRIEDEPTEVSDTVSEDAIATWRTQVEAAFADYPNMPTFPSPPSDFCGRQRCESSKDERALGACSCAIERSFSGVADLKKERLRWHPDRFTTCQDPKTFQKMAKEVFAVVQVMYDRQK